MVQETIIHLPPSLKQKIRCALETLSEDPHLGKPLKDKLKGMWSYRVSRYRIVYRIHHNWIEIQIVAIGQRNLIYERVLETLRVQR